MGVISNGTTLLDAGAIDSGIPTGAMTLIKTLTASSSATLSFVDGTDGVVLDGTYDSYVFKFINIHPATNDTHFQFNGSTDSGSNYNVTKTTTYFNAYHNEADSATSLTYDAGADLAQSTAFQGIGFGVGNDADQSLSGTLQLFNPSSTTFVKHFISDCNFSMHADYTWNGYIAGYFNTTSAIDAIRFQMNGGNIDSGVIKLYGIGG